MKNKTKSKEKKENKFHKFLDIINKKWLIKGTTTLLLIAILIAIYVGVAIILDKVELPQIDTTENKIYSLTDETKEKIGKIDKDITITLINYDDDSEKEKTISRYKGINDKIKVEIIEDVNTRPDLKEKYSLTDSSETLVLVNCEDREHILTEDDFYEMDYSTYTSKDSTEQAVTNAIIDVTTEKKPKIYLVSTHTDYDLRFFGTFLEKLENDANEVEELDILVKGKVPEDCNILIIPTLKDDFTTKEKDSIVEYINNGGELLLLNGPDLGTVEMPNYQQILDLYGITMEKGIVIEQSADNIIPTLDIANLIVENETPNSTIKVASNVKGCLLNASAITTKEEEEARDSLQVEYETLMETSEKAFLKKDFTTQSASRTENDGKEGTYTLGVLATKKIEDTKESKLVIYSSVSFATDITIGDGQTTLSSLYDNMKILTSAVNYLNEREDIITISKSYDETSYQNATEKQHYIILAVTFGIPILIIIIGIVIWQIRRRKK